MRGKFLAAMIVIALGVGARGFFSPADARVSLEKCTLCHGKPEFRKILVDGKIRDLLATGETLKGSVHEKKTCVDCHFDVSEIPHRQRPKRVVCTHCHYKGNAEGAPQSDAYLEYFGSVHGTAIARGNTKAPLCQDCHGSHAIRKAKDPASAVARRGVAETCGRCHIEIYAQYKTSIHGVALSKQIVQADHGGPVMHRVPRGAQDLRAQGSEVHRIRDPRRGAVLDVPRLGRDHEQVRHRLRAGDDVPELVPRRGEQIRLPDRGQL